MGESVNGKTRLEVTGYGPAKRGIATRNPPTRNPERSEAVNGEKRVKKFGF